MPAKPTKILYCRCAHAQVVPADVKDDVLRRLTESGVPFTSVTDLCEMSARQDPVLADLAAAADADTGTLKIAACYPRAVKWLFHAAGSPLPENGAHIECLNMRAQSAEEITDQLLD